MTSRPALDKGYPIDVISVMALLGPKGMQPAALKAWEDALSTVMKEPRFQAFIAKNRFIMSMTTGKEKLDKMMKEEVARYSRFTPEELGWKKK